MKIIRLLLRVNSIVAVQYAILRGDNLIAMDRALLSTLFLLLCMGQLVLCQDCSTEDGQLQFLRDNAETDSACYQPYIDLITEDQVTPDQIQTVSSSKQATIAVTSE